MSDSFEEQSSGLPRELRGGGSLQTQIALIAHTLTTVAGQVRSIDNQTQSNTKSLADLNTRSAVLEKSIDSFAKQIDTQAQIAKLEERTAAQERTYSARQVAFWAALAAVGASLLSWMPSIFQALGKAP